MRSWWSMSSSNFLQLAGSLEPHLLQVLQRPSRFVLTAARTLRVLQGFQKALRVRQNIPCLHLRSHLSTSYPARAPVAPRACLFGLQYLLQRPLVRLQSLFHSLQAPFCTGFLVSRHFLDKPFACSPIWFSCKASTCLNLLHILQVIRQRLVRFHDLLPALHLLPFVLLLCLAKCLLTSGLGGLLVCCKDLELKGIAQGQQAIFQPLRADL
mmetsp:Transcript_85412/g.204679  ORF Transcript_85412/g.204679 Transcript_85412/m.204679 type:complete len:211 (-) Transcript_85412:3586-4218(-)